MTTPTNLKSDKLRQMFDETDMRSVVAAIASISVVGIGIGLSFPLLSLLLEQRGVPASIIGANTAMAGLAAILMVPFITPLARKLGVVNTIVIAIALSLASLFGFYLTDSLAIWFGLRFIFSSSLTTIFVLSEFWINTASNERNRGFILGIYATVLSLGFAIGPGILAVVGTAGILPFAIGGLIISISALPAWNARRNEPVMDEGKKKTPSVFPYLFIVPLATMAALVFGAAEQSELALLPIFGIRSGYSENTAALFLTIVGLGNVALQIPLGIWSDHVSDRRLVLLFCGMVGAVGFLLLPLVVAHVWLLVIILFVHGGVISGMYTVGLAHLGSRLSGTDLAQANAAFVMCYGFGMMLGPQFVGFMMDIVGPAGFGVANFAFFAAFLLLYSVRAMQAR